MDIDPTWLDNAKIAFAGLCGGITRQLFRPAQGATLTQSLLQTFWQLFASVTCAFYGTEPFMGWMEIPLTVGNIGITAATVGFLGLSIAEALLKAFDAFDFKSWLRGMGATK